MIRLPVTAGLACLACAALSQTPNRYSWYQNGPYFRTPAEACSWARQLYDDPEARTMALGKDGFCRESNGAGYRYIKPYLSRGDMEGAASGQSASRRCEVAGLAGRERPGDGCDDTTLVTSGAHHRHVLEVAPAGTYRNVITLDEPARESPRRHH